VIDVATERTDPVFYGSMKQGCKISWSRVRYSAHEDVDVKCHAASRGSVRCLVFRVSFGVEACENRRHHVNITVTSL
jgi:hypothetical protein